MKDKKEQRGTKAEIRAYKKKSQYIGTVVMVAILVAIIAIASFLIYSYLNPSSTQTPSPTAQLKAAIVDHLSLTAPNQTFIQTATNMLETANLTVDYYPGEEVTVDFYRNLPTHGYGLIVLRVHSGIGEGDVLGLFTSENYSQTKYVPEQLDDRLGAVGYLPYHEGDPLYFGIAPKFVRKSMNGKFQNTTIIMMGCEGLVGTQMAEAFIEKGAKVYISWNGGVLSQHTDTATTHLLNHLIIEEKTINEAVTETREEVGPDPIYKSVLEYYPPEAENYAISDVKTNPTTNVAQMNPETIKIRKGQHTLS